MLRHGMQRQVWPSERGRNPWLRHIFADGGYAGGKLRAALKGKGSWTLEIIKRSDQAKGVELPPRLVSRKNLRLAGTLSSPPQRLRIHNRQRRRLPAHRQHPHPHAPQQEIVPKHKHFESDS
jgi:hypothetical protein